MPNEPKTAEPSCRQKLRALGLPYPKSRCDRCGTILREGWRCADEAAADNMKAASYEEYFLEGFRGAVAHCEQKLAEARARLAEAERRRAAGLPVIGDLMVASGGEVR